jgi:predicted kinase
MELLLISGAAATGKTSLGRKLAQELGREFCSKDEIKEKLFDQADSHIGNYERDAKDQMYETIARAIGSGTSLVVEADFVRQDRRRMRTILVESEVQPKEIHCVCAPDVMYRRFVERNQIDRHPGHHDRFLYPSMWLIAHLRPLGFEWNPALELGECRTVETAEPETIDYKSLVDWAK